MYAPHWVHGSAGSSVTGILESEVPPLEGRIFYNYPGQPSPVHAGTLASPSVVARVVKDAQGTNQTQATKYQYNFEANVTRVTDPVGRETLYEYNTNGIDVLAVKQRTGTSGGNPVWTTMAAFAYGPGAPPHRPSSVIDGGGRTTHYTYSTTGQVLTITNAKNEVTTFNYETNTSSAAYGRLLSITGDVAGGNRTFNVRHVRPHGNVNGLGRLRPDIRLRCDRPCPYDHVPRRDIRAVRVRRPQPGGHA
jgi:YD repeat-containing protein